jgi:enoyl-CoA hydratase/carnithine racemase
MPEINIAFIPPIAGTQGLVRLVGRSQAFKILYGGELMDAAAAKEIGLVDFVVPPDKLAAEVQDYAAGLAQKPGNTLAAIRRCLTEGGAMAFEDGLAIERAEAIALSDHANFREGVAAFLQKRGPDWV